MALGLGLEERALDAEFKDNTSFLRLNYYPRCTDRKTVGEDWYFEEPDPITDGVLSINKHTDAGAITILYQRPEGEFLLFSKIS